MTDPQNFIDRMLEVENLTDALEDDNADFLLNWGIEQLKQELGRIEDNEAAGVYTNNLMGFMRMVNHIAGDRENVQTDDLIQMAECRQKAIGSRQELAVEAFDEAAAHIKVMTPHQAIEYLLRTNFKE